MATPPLLHQSMGHDLAADRFQLVPGRCQQHHGIGLSPLQSTCAPFARYKANMVDIRTSRDYGLISPTLPLSASSGEFFPNSGGAQWLWREWLPSFRLHR